MLFKSFVILFLCLGYAQAFFLTHFIGAVANATGLSKLINIDRDAGIRKNGIGAHAGAGGDVLGQKANLHINLPDRDKINNENHKVYSDEKSGRQYILKQVYHGNKYVLERQYLDSTDYYGGNNPHAAKPVDKTSEKFLLVNNEKYPIPSDTESNVYISGNDRGRNNNDDEESVVIRGDDDTEYWVKGNNGKLIRTHVSDNAVPNTQEKVYYYYH